MASIKNSDLKIQIDELKSNNEILLAMVKELSERIKVLENKPTKPKSSGKAVGLPYNVRMAAIKALAAKHPELKSFKEEMIMAEVELANAPFEIDPNNFEKNS